MFEDVQKDHPWAANHRIPVISEFYPRYNYEIALCVSDSSSESYMAHMQQPGEDALPVLSSYLQFRLSYYHDYWAKKMQEAEFDVDPTTNTVIFGLDEYNRWNYRRLTWEHGPRFIEGVTDPTARGLIHLITNRVEQQSAKWSQWMEQHPEVFNV